MELQLRKYEFIKELLKVENVSTMDKLEDILRKEQFDARDTIEEYNRQLDEANARIDKGEFYSQEEVEKIAKEW